MKIKLKVKHLTFLLIAVGASTIFLTTLIIPKLSIYSASDQVEQDDVQWKQRILRKIDSASDKNKWQLIRDYMIEPGPYMVARSYDVYIGPGSSQSSESRKGLREFSWIERISYLEQYLLEAPVDGYLIRTSRQVAHYYDGQGQLHLALQALELGEKRISGSNHHNQQKELMMERIQLYMKYDEIDQAEQLMEQLSERLVFTDQYLKSKFTRLNALKFMRQRELQQALHILNDGIDEYQTYENQVRAEFSDNKAPMKSLTEEQLIAFRDQLAKVLQQDPNAGTTTVSGKFIKSDGTPLAYAGVFLRDQSDVNHSVMEDEPYQTMTDQEGNFKFDGVIPGKYQLFIGLKFEQIDGWTWPVQYEEWLVVDGEETITHNIVLQPLLELVSPTNKQVITEQTIHYQWKEVEGAAYYQLNMGVMLQNGSISSMARSHIEGNEFYLPVEELYDVQMGFSYSERGDWYSVEPLALLRFENTDNLLLWSIEAYDSSGKLITKSDGFRLREDTIGNLPFFYLKARTMTAADHLLLDRQLDEALTEYKKAYEDDPHDLHSLRMIIRMLEAKASIMDDEQYNLEAAPYVERLENKVN